MANRVIVLEMQIIHKKKRTTITRRGSLLYSRNPAQRKVMTSEKRIQRSRGSNVCGALLITQAKGSVQYVLRKGKKENKGREKQLA